MEIWDSRGELIPVRLHHSDGKRVIVVFPGAGYNPDKPLLYYLRKLALVQGYDCLEIWRSYTTPEFQILSPQEAVEQVVRDALAVAEAVIGTYRERVWAGKSMGTVALSAIASDSRAAADPALWLTPVLDHPAVFRALALSPKALVVAGSADPYLNPEALAQLEKPERLVFEGADHSLEVADPHRSLQILAEAMLRIERFLAP